MSTTLRYLVHGYSGRVTGATVEVLDIGPQRRASRAARTLAAWWGAMVVTVFIPIAHFVLVPSCFIGGLIGAALRLKTRRIVTGGSAECPDCGASQALDLRGAWRGISHMTCSACQRALRLAPADHG